jgi:hypothetical protein
LCYGSVRREVAIAHDFGCAEHLGLEFERTVHILNSQPEMLRALKASSEGRIVDCIHLRPSAALGFARRRRCNADNKRDASRTEKFSAIDAAWTCHFDLAHAPALPG